ncbi:murein hydrolase activator EnvC family protein [Marinobacterium aestuariivivens]|uniref:Murein hydrolase activator EnvC family protein n=1 Tax=Marinobacterium aestuariivivens TaxID=1698799 RepID=A0ABW2A1N0_9GAMM
MIRALSLMLLLLYGAALSAADKEATEAQIQRLQKDIGALQSSISRQQGERKSLEQALRDSEAEIGQVGNRMAELDRQLEQLGGRVGSLEEKRDALRRSVADSSDQLNRQLRKQYRLGQQPRLQLLLNQRDPEQLGRMLRYFDLINAELVARLDHYRQQLQALASTESALDDTQAELLASREELVQQRGRLESAREKRRATLAQLRKSIDSEQGRLQALQGDRKRLEGVLAEIEKALKAAELARRSESLPQLRGKLNWPVDGRLLRAFGNSDTGVSYDGMLIAAPAGREVRAVHRGRVVFSDWLRGYGLLLIIDHGGGYMSLYGHNQRLLKEPGAWVETGDRVSVVGNSGGYSDPALYFAVRHNGKPTDPARWLARK